MKIEVHDPLTHHLNGSFTFTVCVRSVLRYHFKLAHVILQMSVKEFFETDF